MLIYPTLPIATVFMIFPLEDARVSAEQTPNATHCVRSCRVECYCNSIRSNNSQETITITGLSSDYYVVIRMDTADFKILKAIADLKVPFPKADKINSLAKLDPEELGARLGVLEMLGYVKTQSQMEMEGSSLPNGISAAGLTNQGKRALEGPRW
jgi:hypothetical protein